MYQNKKYDPWGVEKEGINAIPNENVFFVLFFEKLTIPLKIRNQVRISHVLFYFSCVFPHADWFALFSDAPVFSIVIVCISHK